MKLVILIIIGCFALKASSQTDSSRTIGRDTSQLHALDEIVVSSSRVSESVLNAPVSIELLSLPEIKNIAAPTFFEAAENLKGVQVITPSLGFKVINTRGFANTTNVRFTQLVDGIDNQAPHLGAPIGNALGANDLDIYAIEIIPGTASALYGLNAINGLANIRTKNPFYYQGLSVQQFTGLNHAGNSDDFTPQVFSTTNLRYAKTVNEKFAFKVNLSCTIGTDWVADNRFDLASLQNLSVGLTGNDNPAYDEVNSYGNESSNRKTLTLGGKKYVVARTGYRETDMENYNLKNYKADFGLYYRPKHGHEVSVTYKGALINTIYQRSNRFRLEDYTLHQVSVDYHSNVFQIRSFITNENTGKSYNLRSLAENMDRAFKSDNQWFTDYTAAYNDAISGGATVADAHKVARSTADFGRYEPGTDLWNQKKSELTNINNWDYGAALRVRSNLVHAEGLVHFDKMFPAFFTKIKTEALSGFDYRSYIIIPDGNYFVNPTDSVRNLTYGKVGAFVQLSKSLFNKKLKFGATLRADKADYFNWKLNPRLTVVYAPLKQITIRTSYQSGSRFPSIFEGFSNVNSGGVKRVGGLKIMSEGIFENSYTKVSIDAFQSKVNSDVNKLGISQAQAIENNKGMLQKNSYTYLQPEYVRSFEFGFRALALNNKLFLDADFYYNSYDNFIAQVEASIPNTSNNDSVAIALYSKSTQTRYRLWTNSKSKIYNYGASVGLKFRMTQKYSVTGNFTYSKLDRTDDQDGLEDGFNTPAIMVNGSFAGENIWKNLSASVTTRYQSKFDYVSFLVSGEVPAYWTIDAQVNYYFKMPGITTKVGATNLLNKPYYSILGGSSVGAIYYLSVLLEVK